MLSILIGVEMSDLLIVVIGAAATLAFAGYLILCDRVR